MRSQQHSVNQQHSGVERQQHSVNQKPYHGCFLKCPRSQPRPPPCMASWSLYAKSKRDLFNLPFEKFLHVSKLQSDFCKEKNHRKCWRSVICVYGRPGAAEQKGPCVYASGFVSSRSSHSIFYSR